MFLLVTGTSFLGGEVGLFLLSLVCSLIVNMAIFSFLCPVCLRFLCDCVLVTLDLRFGIPEYCISDKQNLEYLVS